MDHDIDVISQIPNFFKDHEKETLVSRSQDVLNLVFEKISKSCRLTLHLGRHFFGDTNSTFFKGWVFSCIKNWMSKVGVLIAERIRSTQERFYRRNKNKE